MTIIAYRDDILAADRRAIWGSRPDENRKLYCLSDGNWAGLSGASALVPRWLHWYAMGPPWNNPIHETHHGNTQTINALVVTPDGVVSLFASLGPEGAPRFPFVAIGSGEEIAMGAMHHGATAIESVQAAIDLDVYCGGGIDWVNVRTGERGGSWAGEVDS